MTTIALAYAEKFKQIAAQTLLDKLPKPTQEFISTKATQWRFTQQELREVCLIANNLFMWKTQQLPALWPQDSADKKQQFKVLRSAYQALLEQPKSYGEFSLKDKPKTVKPNVVTQQNQTLGMGVCPVASEQTHCCNLLTLDAVERCGFDCSYCSIQSFYHQNEVRFDADFEKKLAAIKLDPKQRYHMGTGQSSDSLMWGNHNNNLAALCDFAADNPNVILEFKTKSKNISWLLEHDYPPNVICAWSLNPQTVIDCEEHQTASLDQRINSAAKIAAKGRLVGFHFHPMIWIKGHEQAYADIAQTLMQRFSRQQVAMVSMGSLTYTKSVMRTIRQRDFKSKILQMPLQKVAGKYAYPEAIKVALFQFLYKAFAPWQTEVFFYLCMEPAALWPQVFNRPAYTNNQAFEAAMKAAYGEKIMAISGR